MRFFYLFISTALLFVTELKASQYQSLDSKIGTKHACDQIPNVHYKLKQLLKEPNKERRLRGAAILKCQSFPLYADFTPSVIEIVKDHHLDAKTHIDLENVKIVQLENKTDEQLYSLLTKLAHEKVMVKWIDRNSKKHSHTKEFNGAIALMLSLVIDRKFDLISRFIYLAPVELMPLFQGPLAVILDSNILSVTLVKIIKSLEVRKKEVEFFKHDLFSERVRASSELIWYYLKSWSFGKHQNIDSLLKRDILKLFEASKYDLNSEVLSHVLSDFNLKTIELTKTHDQLQLDSEHMGILMGCVLSGAYLFSDEIKAHDEKVIWGLNTASNLGWAATSFFATIPIAGTGVAVLSGTVSMILVSIAARYSKKGPHDESPNLRRIEGEIEVELLRSTTPNTPERESVQELINWMHTVIRANGFA